MLTLGAQQGADSGSAPESFNSWKGEHRRPLKGPRLPRLRTDFSSRLQEPVRPRWLSRLLSRSITGLTRGAVLRGQRTGAARVPRLEKCRCSEEPGELVVEGFLCQMERGWGTNRCSNPRDRLVCGGIWGLMRAIRDFIHTIVLMVKIFWTHKM